MAIPTNISKQDILQALAIIDKMITIPPKRGIRKYVLNHNEKKYPPKLVISIANKFPNKEELSPDASVFTTEMAQKYLKKHGFNNITKLK